ncbi:MAG TPA: tetratricopeptide repeat protein [Edaphobacter sp.]|nr:tetratricopeptide repeat protein [Edaphobacter sp.]
MKRKTDLLVTTRLSKHYRRSLFIAAFGLAILTLLSAGGFYAWRQSQRPPSAVKAIPGYADPAICAGCHADVAATYRMTGMGRSFHRITNGKRIEDFKARNTLYHKPSNIYYTMLELDGKFYESRDQIGFEGKRTNQEEKQIDFVIGSGNHARTYLHRTSEGKLIELPVSWYTEMGGYWGMSPGYDHVGQQDFRRVIGSDCMFCHNDYPEQQPSSTDGEAILEEKLPEGIGCQRCHGPGQTHVDIAMAAGKTLEEIRAAIVNPARLGRDRQMEVCMECHLETTSSPLPNAIRRYDRKPFSYRPGEPLSDYEITFDRQPGTGFDDRFEVAHQAYRLRKSACFRNSQMTCITCHNPHQIPRGEQAVKHYVAVCAGCHTKPHKPALTAADSRSTCLDCHMWKRRTDDVVHVVMTDHYIQRIKPKRNLLAPFKESVAVYRGKVIPYYPDAKTPVRDRELYLAVAQVEHDSNLKAGIMQLQHAIEVYQPKDPEFYLELGKAYSKTGNNAEAIHWFEAALQRRKDFHPALREMSVALARTGSLSQAIEIGERAAASQPLDTATLTNLGNLYLQAGRSADARRVLGQALSINPDLADANNLIGMAWLQGDNAGAAESSFREAIRTQPDLAEAHNNLGNLLAGNGDYAQAIFEFQKAIESNPFYVEAYHSYGLLLGMTGPFNKAVTVLQQAVHLDPKSASLHVDLGDVLAEHSSFAAAREQYIQAIGLDPESGEAYLGLGNLLAAQKAYAEAEVQFRLAIKHNSSDGRADLGLAQILARRGALSEAREHYQKAAESTDGAIRRAAISNLQ